MAKVGKLTKLKSALKRWPSLTKHHQPSSPAGKSVVDKTPPTLLPSSGEGGLRTVYVGKSRRRYQLSLETVHHPLFQELVDRSSRFQENEDQDCVIVVACEVVLFEHLLWMLRNNHGGGGGEGDGDEHQSGSMEELVGFYTND